MNLSIIIPTYNEETCIADTLSVICNAARHRKDTEIIISDSGEDNTLAVAAGFPVKTCRSPKGRAVQMNRGAEVASGRILCFLHADTLPPEGFIGDIISAVEQGSEAGCFQLTFDDPHWLMQTYGWFTRFPLSVCRGGDQALFITHKLFKRIGGFNEGLRVMEDIEILERINKHTSFRILDGVAVTSARKYHINGRVRLQILFGIVHLLYTLGFDQDIIADYYSRNID